MNILLLIFVVLLTLKLCGVIALSWLWVTAPLWVGAVFVLVMWAIAFSAATAMSRSFTNRRSF